MKLSRILILIPLLLGSLHSDAPPAPQQMPNVITGQLHQACQAARTLQKHLLDELDLSSKGIDLEFSLLGQRIVAAYKARWGYMGVGKADQPFTGFQAQFRLPVTIAKGLTIDPLQAERLQEIGQAYQLKRFVQVSATDEFHLKLLQLVVALVNDEIDTNTFWDNLRVVIKRIAITPSFKGIHLEGWRLIGTKEHPGYLETLLDLPEEKVAPTRAWLVALIKSAAPLLGLSATRDPHALTTMMQSIDFTNDDELVFTQDDQSLAKITFGYRGPGNDHGSMGGCILHLNLPISQAANEVFERVEKVELGLPENFVLTLPLGPAVECSCKAFMALASMLNGKLEPHQLPHHIETLIHRLLITPRIKDVTFRFAGLRFKLLGTPVNPGLLRLISTMTHSIMKHTFDSHDQTPLSYSQAAHLLACIGYRAYIDYIDARFVVRSQLMQTEDGQQALKKLTESLEVYKHAQSEEAKAAADKAYTTYRTLELSTGKEQFETISNFVIDEIARVFKRIKHHFSPEDLIKSVGIIQEFEDHGISVDLSRFWRVLGENNK